jgi:transcriptional regulator with XRE-family HTH domain
MKGQDNQKLRELFGNRLNHFRTEKNLSYRQLAQLCNVDHSQISKIEKGKVSIQLDTLFDLATALGIQPKDLFEFDLKN